MATAERHRELSARLLDQAEEELRKGDLLQASEKAWGAVVHCVNSIARERGWPVGSHRNVNENALRLIRGPAYSEHRRRLTTLNALHANFYEDYLADEMVQDGVADARELVRVLNERNDSPS